MDTLKDCSFVTPTIFHDGVESESNRVSIRIKIARYRPFFAHPHRHPSIFQINYSVGSKSQVRKYVCLLDLQ